METTTTTPILAMEIGTWVRTKDIDTAAYNNKIGKIKDRFQDDKVWVLFQNQEYDGGDRELILSLSKLEVLEDQENAQQHQTLEAWQSRYNSAKERLDRMHVQFDYLCDVITETAVENGYCNEYDEVVDTVNSRMAAKGYSMGLRQREREYEVEVTFRATVEVTTTVMVTATSEDAACEYVDDCPSDFMDMSQLLIDDIGDSEPDFEIIDTSVR